MTGDYERYNFWHKELDKESKLSEKKSDIKSPSTYEQSKIKTINDLKNHIQKV